MKSYHYFFYGLCLFCFVVLHYLLWVYWVVPLPEKDGLAQYYYPLLNYLRAAEAIGNDYQFLSARFFGAHYPHGPAFIAWFVSFSGLGSLILKEPYLLHLILILPLVVMPCFLLFGRKNFFLSGICICFFPAVQICLKLFSLQAINVIYFVLAVLFFRSWLAKGKWTFLVLFIISCWFSGIAKHLGVLFFLSLVSSYISWEILNRRLRFPAYGAFVMILIGFLPFYYLSNQFEYVKSSVGHGPDLQMSAFLSAAAFLFLCPPLMAGTVFFRRHKKTLPKFFRGGFLLLVLSFFSLMIIAGDFFTPWQIMLCGVFIFFALLYWYDFTRIRGFIYILIMLNFIAMLALYRTGAGHVPYTMFAALLLALIQTISENRSRGFLVAMAFIMLLAANFFPGLRTLDNYFGYFGRRIYLGGFKSPHQNPLGWQKYCYGELKRQVIKELSEVGFSEPPRFLVHNLGPLTEAQFVFFDNVLFPFPKMGVLRPFARDIYEQYLQKGEVLFSELLENGDIPVVLYATVELPEEDREIPISLSLKELLARVDFSGKDDDMDLFADVFNSELILWLDKKGFLNEYYHCQALPRDKPCARLCISRKLYKNDHGIDFGAKFLQDTGSL